MQQAAYDPQAAPSRLIAWWVLALMLLLYAANYMDRYLVAGLAESIRAELQVSDTYMGLMMGPAFAFFYSFAGIPLARYADRTSRVRVIVMGAFVWSVFTVASGFAPNAAWFAAARVGVGVGEAAFLAPAYSLLSDYFPMRRRGLAFAILNLGVYIGNIGGLVGGAAIAEAYDWRTAFVWLGLPGIALGVLTLLTVREPMKGRLDPAGAKPKSKASFMRVAAALWSVASYRKLAIGAALGGFGGYTFGFWGPTLFARAFELNLTEANARFGFAFGLFGLAGVLLLGWLSDRLAPRDARWPARLSAIGVAGSALCMIGACYAPNANIATLFAVPAGILGGGWMVALQSSLQDLMPGTTRSTGTSILAFGLTFGGLVFGVQAAGVLTDLFSGAFGDQAVRHALAVILLACLPAGWLILSAADTLTQDAKDLAARIDAEEAAAEAAEAASAAAAR